MIVSINQPAYLPWLGYFERIIRSDVHVVLDHVQFEKNSFTNRNQIMTPNGPIWLTIPVRTAKKFGDLPICDIEVSNQHWRKKHLKSIISNYQKAKYFDLIYDFLTEFYNQDDMKLNDINSQMLNFFLQNININTKIIYSSKMDITGKKDELVLNICKALNANTYLSGAL